MKLQFPSPFRAYQFYQDRLKTDAWKSFKDRDFLRRTMLCTQGAANAFGTFDTERMIFTPDDSSVGHYDNGDGHASKSYWDEKTNRRIMWSWISGRFPCSNPQGFECDSMQSVPCVCTATSNRSD
jgi:hypothetical protein